MSEEETGITIVDIDKKVFSGKPFDLITGGDVAEALPNPHLLPDGKSVVKLGLPENRTVLVRDKDMVVTKEGDKVRISRTTAEIHETDEDLVTGVVGPMIFYLGGELENPRKAKNPDGSIKPRELIGDGIIGGTRVEVNTGDTLRIPAGMPHVHGTEPGRVAAAKFVKINTK